MIEGIREIDEGSAIIDGIDVGKDARKAQYIIGVQPQSPAFQGQNKTQRDFRAFCRCVRRKVDTSALLESVDLLEKPIPSPKTYRVDSVSV